MPRRKAAGVLKLVHEKYLKDEAERSQYLKEFSAAMDANDHLRPLLSKVIGKACPHASIICMVPPIMQRCTCA